VTQLTNIWYVSSHKTEYCPKRATNASLKTVPSPLFTDPRIRRYMTCEIVEESPSAKLPQFNMNRRKVEIVIVIQDNHLKPSGNYVHNMVYHYTI